MKKSMTKKTKPPQKRAEETGFPVMVRFQNPAVEKIDETRRAEPDLPSRPEMIRRLVDEGLKARR